MEEWYQQWNDIAIEYISTTEYPYLDDMYKHNRPLCGKINPHEAMTPQHTWSSNEESHLLPPDHTSVPVETGWLS